MSEIAIRRGPGGSATAALHARPLGVPAGLGLPLARRLTRSAEEFEQARADAGAITLILLRAAAELLDD